METEEDRAYEGIEPEIAGRIDALYKLSNDLRADQKLDALRSYAAVAVLIAELDKMAEDQEYNPANTCFILAMAKEHAAALAGLTRSSQSLDVLHTSFLVEIGKLDSVLCFRRDK